MTSYTDEVKSKLDPKLVDILQKAGVQSSIAEFLVQKNLSTVQAFADLADSKTEIITNLGRPAGLDHTDAIVCQPLKTAWRNAEAARKADLDALAKGEDPHTEIKIEDRAKLDKTVREHFKFDWPAQMMSDDSTLAKMKTFYQKRTQWVPRLAEMRSILDKSESNEVLLKFYKAGGSVSTLPSEVEIEGEHS